MNVKVEKNQTSFNGNNKLVQDKNVFTISLIVFDFAALYCHKKISFDSHLQTFYLASVFLLKEMTYIVGLKLTFLYDCLNGFFTNIGFSSSVSSAKRWK